MSTEEVTFDSRKNGNGEVVIQTRDESGKLAHSEFRVFRDGACIEAHVTDWGEVPVRVINTYGEREGEHGKFTTSHKSAKFVHGKWVVIEEW